MNTGVPEEKEFLESILKELPQDTDWDISKPIQKIYKDRGIIRYRLVGEEEIGKKRHVEQESETVASSSNSQGKKSKLDVTAMLRDKQELDLNTPPGWLTFKAELAVLQTGEKSLSTKVADMQKLYVKLKLDASTADEAAEMKTSIQKVTEFHDTLLEALSVAASLTQETPTQDLSNAITALTESKSKTMAWVDSSRAVLKKFTGLVKVKQEKA